MVKCDETEDLFDHLARQLHPERVLLAGLEAGVWADFPSRERMLVEITPDSVTQMAPSLGAAIGADVTGGMHSKVTGMMSLIEAIPDLKILIFSGEQPGNLRTSSRNSSGRRP